MANLNFLERDPKKPFTKKEAIKLFRYIYKIKAERLGYRKPAKGARYNLRDQKSLISLYQNLDPFGGHLYKNRGVV